ncbi:nicotinate phosphoribosyltransferase [Synechococcus sp. CBW1002]|uniref:nicotinate phosphoribosyltransferase n=1 Tax=Synechococcus sp. CBW1002 TaxID=1353134 RepID=UPI0018CD4C88|nr:nicotinate phosphoribosyltransferase [Synechococcus sp. CBW1002]QPN60425.1 nicotinate phosphoribosyltransferase [Synechococcus sp. CBW1002]
METNLLFDTDSYKTSHWLQYPPDLTAMGAYLESRGGENPATLFFGLQMLLLQSFTTPITQADVEEAEEFWQSHGLPFNRPGWERVVQVHGGRLPLLIRAVPDGSRVPTGQVLMTVESTDPQLAWLVTWVETQLLRIWYPTTVATRSWQLRTVLAAALERSADDPAVELAFRLHDFGSRGVSSLQSAAIGGLAHLIAFRGSDTGAALVAGRRHYDCPMAGFSIPAAEHSTVLAWGQKHEAQAYRNMLDHFARPGAVLAVVSDSYDLWNAVDHLWGEQLRPQVIEAGATVVIRPDSGDPVRIVPELLRRLEARFGSRMNGKGYRVLQHVRVIQGDGITAQTLPLVLEAVLAAGFSAENVAYGMGGGLLQQLNRDTQRFVYKASWVERSGQILPVHKRPITDPAKTSKAGVLDLIHTGGTYRTIVRPLPGIHPDSCLQTVYENGELLNRCSLDQVRERAVLG